MGLVKMCRNFLPRKHFVILSGLSGTGKTQLAIKYARAVHGLGQDVPDDFLFVCPVRPEWTDATLISFSTSAVRSSCARQGRRPGTMHSFSLEPRRSSGASDFAGRPRLTTQGFPGDDE
jgi:hypothetical protein